MRRILLCLLWAVAPSRTQVSEEPGDQIAIYYRFLQEPQGGILQTAEGEVNAILAPLDQPLEWRTMDSAKDSRPTEELAVVTFAGDCSPAPHLPRRFDYEALGITHVQGGQIIPFTEVDCDRVHGVVDQNLRGLSDGDRDLAFGRAVGRVLAHELYHVFADTRHHMHDGTAKERFNVEDLLGAELPIVTAMLNGSAADDHSVGLEYGKSLYVQDRCNTCHGESGEGTAKAPALKESSRLNALRLAAKVDDRRSTMARAARKHRITFHSLGVNQARSLARFVKSLPRKGAAK